MSFKVNDWVKIDYGVGTVVELVPDAAGLGRQPLVAVRVDGQVWFRDPEEVVTEYIGAIEPRDEGGTMSPLPAPDPAAGGAAEEVAEQTRRDTVEALSTGGLTLHGLFDQVDQESKDGDHRPVGHMHLKRALLALPFIGNVKANEILAEVELLGSEHLAELGVRQRNTLVETVQAHMPPDSFVKE